jgi:hypothetical protein
MLAMVEMPEGKVIRLPDDWDKYRGANDSGAIAPGRIA